VLKRQRTILGRLLREVRRKMGGLADETRAKLETWVQRAERIHRQRPQDKNKLYALHAPEAECISKGKARQPYECGVKVSLAVTHQHGWMVGARSFPGNFLFSTGPNSQCGGKRTTRGHYDVPMRHCTIALDGKVVVDEGRLVDPKMIVPRVQR
jgi:hypothetical protein